MVGIPMRTNWALLLADLLLENYSCENEILDKFIKEGKRKLARQFHLSHCYIDDLLNFNNKRFKVIHFSSLMSSQSSTSKMTTTIKLDIT